MPENALSQPYPAPRKDVKQMEFDFSKQKLPMIYKRLERECYLDPTLLHYGVKLRGRVDILLHKYNREKDEQIENLPQYTKMIRGEYIEVPEEEPVSRLEHEEISKNLNLYRGFDMGKDTEKKLLIPLINFLECLLEPGHELPCKKYKLFTVIKDMHVRLLSYGNAGGGSFQGVYRSFMIEYRGSTEIISFGISTYVSHAKPNQVKTAICVAVDNEKETHHSLQLVADDNLYVWGNKVTFYHHGRIAVGKIDELREFVTESYPEIIDGKRFNLGTLADSHLWSLDEPDVIKVMENFISYALIRDEYRTYVKNRNHTAY